MNDPILNPDAVANAIIREACRFVGLKEIRPNARWDDPTTPGIDVKLCQELRDIMRPSPWQEGWAYCAAFVEGVVGQGLGKAGASAQQIARFARVMGPHVLTSFNGFHRLGLISTTPSRGSIWLAQHGVTTRGHCGIVTCASAASMSTIEANTSLDASTPAKEREGDWITTRIRNRNTNGKLRTRGYLSVAALIRLVNA